MQLSLNAVEKIEVLTLQDNYRDAVMHIEKEMPDSFLLNMAGTKMTFS